MRHIPEDELHAYLDQALSRSQCVEIESHLAGCAACRAERDGIAALRDRTTALLATLTPPRGFMPAPEVLRERAAERSARRRDRWRAGMWAASVMLALGLGWTGKAMLETGGSPTPGGIAANAESPDTAAAPAADSAVPEAVIPTPRQAEVAATTPASRTGTAARDAAPAPDPDFTAPVSIEPVSTVLSSGQLPGTPLNVDNGTLFRTVSWDNARNERGESMPRIAGLPVVEVQVGTSHGGTARPLVVVAQQLESGQVIRTIEGPATDVTKLLASQRSDTGSPWPTIADSIGIAGGDGAMAMRRGDRILAITAPLSSDSLRAMIRRLNAGNR